MKLTEALKEFNDVAINVKILDIQKEIMIVKFNAAVQRPEFFGLNFDAEGGANLQ